jgi:pimeloyl-ACP methyl ester carboxylesterase
MQITHHRASANGIHLHYVTAGKGFPILLIHGWPQSWWTWRKVIELLAPHYRLIVPDLRGFGDSDKPASGYDKKTMAADLEALTGQLGLRRFAVVSHDKGAEVGYSLAATRPDLVTHYAMLESALVGFGMDHAMDVLKSGLWHLTFHMARDMAEFLVQGREREYLTYFFRHHAFDPETFSVEEINRFAGNMSRPGALRAGFEVYRSYQTDLADNQVLAQTKLKMPVLGYGGESSIGEAVLYGLRAVAGNVEGGVFTNCGHWIPEEKPQELAQVIRGFVGSPLD